MSSSYTDPANAASIWSALAATFAALAAFLTWMAQVKTLRHTFRPDITIGGWSRVTLAGSQEDSVRFHSIKNIGRDSARQVVINASAVNSASCPIYSLSTVAIPSLGAGEAMDVISVINLVWKNVESRGPAGMLIFIDIKIWYWGALNVRHLTKIGLLATQDLHASVAAAPCLAPGMYAATITTKSEAVWRLKLNRTLGRIPIVGKRYFDVA